MKRFISLILILVLLFPAISSAEESQVKLVIRGRYFPGAIGNMSNVRFTVRAMMDSGNIELNVRAVDDFGMDTSSMKDLENERATISMRRDKNIKPYIKTFDFGFNLQDGYYIIVATLIRKVNGEEKSFFDKAEIQIGMPVQ